jgi:hypothetical protein
MPTIDKRELIMARLAEITTAAKTGAGFVTCIRNRGFMSTDKRPACVLLDGDERAKLTHDRRNGRAQGMTPSIMTMSPELYILLAEGRPNNEDVGQTLNAKRIALIAAIAGDAALKDLTGSNGSIVYNGCVTDLKSGSQLLGEMRLDFTFTYVLDPL